MQAHGERGEAKDTVRLPVCTASYLLRDRWAGSRVADTRFVASRRQFDEQNDRAVPFTEACGITWINHAYSL